MGFLPYQQRVIEERDGLADKVRRLEAFLYGPTFSFIPQPEQKRLSDQHKYMESYLRVLKERIEAF